MMIKILGAILVTCGCSAFGIMIAAAHKKETATLRNFLSALDILECELQYRYASLPELCTTAAHSSKGVVKDVLVSLAGELDKQVSPDVEKCMQAALSSTSPIPKMTADAFLLFGQSLGRFDLDGQLKGLDAVRTECNRVLEIYTCDQEKRLRCYQTLGVCAGAALAILFV